MMVVIKGDLEVIMEVPEVIVVVTEIIEEVMVLAGGLTTIVEVIMDTKRLLTSVKNVGRQMRSAPIVAYVARQTINATLVQKTSDH